MWVATISQGHRALTDEISTHTTHVGGDTDLDITLPENSKFQLTPPMWVATTKTIRMPKELVISTHATHKGGDTW